MSASTIFAFAPVARYEFQNFMSTLVDNIVDAQPIQAQSGFDSEENVVLNTPKSIFFDSKRRTFFIFMRDSVMETRQGVHLLA